MNNKLITEFTFYVRYILSGITDIDTSPYKLPYLNIHPTIEISNSESKNVVPSAQTDGYLHKALEYFMHNNLKSSRQVEDFLVGLKKVHDGDEENFLQQDAEDYGSVTISYSYSKKDLGVCIYRFNPMDGFKEISTNFVPYEEFVEFLEYWKKFLLEIENLRLVPKDYIKEEKLDEVEKNQQFKDMEKRLIGDE